MPGERLYKISMIARGESSLATFNDNFNDITLASAGGLLTTNGNIGPIHWRELNRVCDSNRLIYDQLMFGVYTKDTLLLVFDGWRGCYLSAGNSPIVISGINSERGVWSRIQKMYYNDVKYLNHAKNTPHNVEGQVTLHYMLLKLMGK